MEALNNINLILSVILKLILLVALIVTVFEFIRLSKTIRKFIDDINKIKNGAEYIFKLENLQNIVKLFVEFNVKTLLVRLIDTIVKRQPNS